jgi:hypothetical protein
VALALWSARAEALVQGEGFVTVAVGPFRSGSMNDLLVGAGAPEQPHQGDPEADG